MKSNLDRERRQFILGVLEAVAIHGFAEVSDFCMLDDPPRHPIAEFALGEYELRTRGRWIDPPKTLFEELKKTCEERDLEFSELPFHRVAIVAKVKQPCSACSGTGRTTILQYVYKMVPSAGTMVDSRVCPTCLGSGKSGRFKVLVNRIIG